MKIIFILLISFYCISSDAQISENGHPEHFIGGLVIGGVTSYLVYKKTNNKFKSWVIGTGAAAVIGLTKELIDSATDRKVSGEDFGYTLLGGTIGASIVFPLKKKKPKEVAYLF